MSKSALHRSSALLHTPTLPMILEAWKMRNHSNMLFITYEEMKENIDGVIDKMCDFLSLPRLDQERMDILKKHIKFDNLKVGTQ